MKNYYLILSFLVLSLFSGAVFGQLPQISSFSPASGPVGTTVTITGSNFNTTVASNLVFFGSVKATATTATATQLVVTVPPGATSVPISVINTAGILTGYAAKPFITTYSPVNNIDDSGIDLNVDFTTGTSPYSVAAADIDGDGKTDVISANAGSNTFSVLLNTATGKNVTSTSFVAKKDFVTLATPTDVSVADLNGDGKPDVVVVYQLTNTVSIFTNSSTAGTVSFAARKDYVCGSGSSAVCIGDIDNNGLPDIIIANFNTNSISILRNISTAATVSFAAHVDFTTGSSPGSLVLADIDGDGKQDIIVGNYAVNTISVLKNNAATGSITTSSIAPKVDFAVGGEPTGLSAGDIDGDGKQDVVVANYNATRNAVSILKNTATTGITATSLAAPVDFTTGSQPVSISLADINGDGKLDIVAADYNNKTISILKNTTTVAGTINSSALAAKADFAAGITPYAIAIGDIDNDGKADVISANDFDNTISVFHNYNVNAIPGPVYPESTASVSVGSFVNTDIYDTEWEQEAPPGYSVASDDGITVNGTGGAGTNAGRFVYFGTIGATVPSIVKVHGNLTFTAKGSGTIEVQIIPSCSGCVIAARKTFTLTSAFQDFGWKLTDLYPQTEYILAVIFNGGNSSPNASGSFKKNMCLTLTQGNMTGYFTRYRADGTSLIGNTETGWYGWNDSYLASRKKYLQHSAYARMRFTTDATRFTLEYVRDFYDKRVVNIFPVLKEQNNVDWDANGNIVTGYNVINNSIKVISGQTYTISGLLTNNPTYVWFDGNGAPLALPQTIHDDNPSDVGLPPLAPRNPWYKLTAPANARTLGLLVQRISNPGNFGDLLNNDSYLVYANCMIQAGAIGDLTTDGKIPTSFLAYTGDTPSYLSGPAVFVNGSLYKYYQVEGNDIAKTVQYLSDVLPAGTKTVEIMTPGQGTYLPADPHVRRSGTFLRAVYLPSSITTELPASTKAAGSILFIHDSILSGFNISSDAQNNVWMMKILRDPTFGFTGDVFSEGYAGRILHTDTNLDTDGTKLEAFAQKLAASAVDKYWFQIGVNDYGFLTPLHKFYIELKTLVERLKVLRPNAKIYIQGTGPEFYTGPNGETYSDDGLAATGPTANDYRDVQRAIATTHSYCEYVDFENIFSPIPDALSDGIHPTDVGNTLYALGIKYNSTLLGTVPPVTTLMFNPGRTTDLRDFIQTIPSIATVTAVGGKIPYVFSLLSGTLPTGLTFNNNGTITGTPTSGGVTGNIPLSIKVTDANAATATQTFNLTINPIPQVVVARIHIPNAQANVTYNQFLRGVGGSGNYALTFTGTMPAGMSYNTTTGLFTGKPPAAHAAVNFTVSAVDHWGFAGSTAYSFTVGTGTPAALTDHFSPTASLVGNTLYATGHLHDYYDTELFTFIYAYVTQGGVERGVGGTNVNVLAGQMDGTPISLGNINPAFGAVTSIRLNMPVTGGVAPTQLDGVNITYDVNTIQ